MIKPKIQPLTPYLSNKYSQNGEDGIIDFLITQLLNPASESFVVDVGAWDGEYLSNTKHQIDQGSTGLLIEADEIRAKAAEVAYLDNKGIKIIVKHVDRDYPLSEALASYDSQNIFLLLSIDIDGDDLEVLKSIGSARPKIVVCEFSPVIPNHIEFQNPTGQRVGNSALAILNFANSLGYGLAHATSTNLILFDKVSFKTSISNLVLDMALDDTDTIKAVFAGYDGTINIVGPKKLDFPWHGLSFDLNLPELPKVLQHFPEEFTSFGKLIYRFYWFRQYWFGALRNRISRILTKCIKYLSN
jgi:hypothetical protein